MERDNALVSGFVFLGLGILITIATYALAPPGGVYLVATGAIITGVVRIFRALSMPSNDLPLKRLDESDERMSASDKIQVAGKKCAVCEKRILSNREGKVCKRCGVLMHDTCEIDHKRVKHPRRKRSTSLDETP